MLRRAREEVAALTLAIILADRLAVNRAETCTSDCILTSIDGRNLSMGRVRSEWVPQMLFGTQVGAGQQQQSRQKRPEHHAH
jgi:hypothetical protein